MNSQDKNDPKSKLKRIAKLLLIYTSATFFIIGAVMFAHYFANTKGFEFRVIVIRTAWFVAAIWGMIFVGCCLLLCGTLYAYPQQIKQKRIIQKIGTITMIIIIVIVTGCAYYVGLMIFSFSKLEEKTMEIKGITYIVKHEPYVIAPSRISYHKVINALLYERKQSTDMISIETYTGIIQSCTLAGGDSGSVKLLQVSVGNGEIMMFTLTSDDKIKGSNEVPIGVDVQIKCERHPNSSYRPILSIVVQ